MKKEIWKDIEGYEGLYQVSNLGRVKSLSRIVNSGNGKMLTKEIILTAAIGNHGYYVVRLSKDNVGKCFTVHSLVANAFLEKKYEVNHINGIKTDNSLDNLEWTTRAKNARHSYRLGLKIPINGEKCKKSKLKTDDVLDIRNLYRYKKYSQVQIAEIYKVSDRTIFDIVHHKSWKHIK